MVKLNILFNPKLPKAFRCLVVKSQLRSQWVPGSKPDSAVHAGLADIKSDVVGQMPFRWCRVDARSSSSDRGSKLRGQSQNDTRVASRRDFTITKLINLQMPAITR
ncbi:hypothetical protein AVEN_201191-1 [Araneus ventricosus]|uniref:Uncharacterized protein n=1 Tax=Araneus ventricosus TaxID=182803 RepID=A0A4Y2W5W1_ARAVE|nr:hypothetical protein AVEN_201191-1 [Araneus ventricosus]